MAYVKAEVVAEHLGVSKKTVYKLAREGKIPSYRIGRMVRFSLEDIDEEAKEGRDR